MLLECESCGAPLDVPPGAAPVRVQCHYCGRSADIGRFRTVAQETPQGFVPPPEWTPPPDSKMRSRALPYRPNARRLLSSLGLVGLAMLALGGFVVFRLVSVVQDVVQAPAGSDQVRTAMSQAFAAVSAAVSLAQRAKQVAGQGASGDEVPVLCKGSDDMTITGKSLALAQGVPVVASGSCT